MANGVSILRMMNAPAPARRLIRALQAATAALALLATGAAPAHAQTATGAGVAAQLDRWFAAAERAAPGKWGIAVADANGTPIWSVNANDPMTPASTVKLFTTGFARSVLGATARKATRFLATGSVTPSGELVGEWMLELNGDPTFERLPGAGPTLDDLAAQLAGQGVKKISGSLHVQSGDGAPATASYPSTWSLRHRGRLFAPPVGAIVLHENTVFVTVAPGPKVGSRARLVGDSPRGIASLVAVTATTTGGRRSRLGLAPNKNGGWTLTGRIGVSAGSRSIAAVAQNPLKVLEAAWGSSLARAGIAWSKADVPTIGSGAPPRPLATVSSGVLDSVASEVNRRSLNVGAEALLRWATGFGEGGAAQLTTFVREVTGLSDVHLVDGSGLSEEDRASPSAFVRYLARFPQTEAGHNFPLLLPANGEGTLRRMNRGLPAPGIVRAKTGTLRDVVTVSGYLGRNDGVLILSLMYKGGRPWAARQEQWKLFRLLGAQGAVVPGDAETNEAQLGGPSEADDAPAPPAKPQP